MSAASRHALLAWALVGAAALAVLAAQPRAEATEATGTGGQRGAQLYALHCAQCHAADGGGGPMQRYEGEAPSLLPADNPDISAAYVDLVMATGRMPPAGSPYDNRERRVIIDTEEDRAAVIQFMRDEFGIPGEIPDIGEGDATRGQAVWNTNCAHCHGATGQGGVAGAGAWTPQVTGLDDEVIAEAIRVGPFEMPAFRESQISDGEIADVVAFLDEVEAEQGTPIFGLVELNPVFASAFVALLALLMLVSLAWIGGRPARFADAPREDAAPEVPSGATRRTQSEDGS